MLTGLEGTKENNELGIYLSFGYELDDYVSLETPEWIESELLGDSTSGISFLTRIIAAITNFFRMIISFFS